MAALAVAGAELEVDLSAFLPEGVTLEAAPSAEAAVPDQETVLEVASAQETVPDQETVPEVGSAPVADDSIDLALIESVDADLTAVEAALAALDDGTYGTCVVCRSAIEPDVLASDPVRRTCPAHA